MPQVNFDPSVPAADRTTLTAIAGKLFDSVPAINDYLGHHGSFHARFPATITVTMNHATYPGGPTGRLELPPNPNPGKLKHLWQAPNLGGLTSNDRRTIYLAPAALYWVGLQGFGGKKSAAERFIHEMIHASIVGIAGGGDPHKPEFYLAEQQWFGILGLPFPPAEQAAFQMSLHAH